MLGVVVVHQLLTLDTDPCTLGNGACDEGVTADDDVFADDGIAAENRRSRIDRHVVMNGRVAFFAAQVLTAAGGERAERHALIDLDVVADHGRFTDNDARAVVNEEVLTDRRARVDVDTGQAVGVLRHDARYQRNAEQKQLVGDSRGKDCVQARIGANDLVLVIGGGVAFIERLNFGFDVFAYLRYFIKEVKGDPLGHLRDRFLIRVAVLGRVFQHDRRLLDEVVDDILYQNGNVIFDRIGAVVAVAVIARVDYDFSFSRMSMIIFLSG